MTALDVKARSSEPEEARYGGPFVRLRQQAFAEILLPHITTPRFTFDARHGCHHVV